MYWQYRAYDAEKRIHFGICEDDSFTGLCLHLRQKGLCVLDANTICKTEFMAKKRLAHMKRTIDHRPLAERPKLSIIKKILSYFFRTPN